MKRKVQEALASAASKSNRRSSLRGGLAIAAGLVGASVAHASIAPTPIADRLVPRSGRALPSVTGEATRPPILADARRKKARIAEKEGVAEKMGVGESPSRVEAKEMPGESPSEAGEQLVASKEAAGETLDTAARAGRKAKRGLRPKGRSLTQKKHPRVIEKEAAGEIARRAPGTARTLRPKGKRSGSPRVDAKIRMKESPAKRE